MTTDSEIQPHLTVARALLPARTFDKACALVVDYLSDVVPLGMWAVTRVADGRQVILVIRCPAYGVPVGAEINFQTSLCRVMVSGRAPQIAPDLHIVPEYAAVAAALPFPAQAYLGAPIVRSDGELFGTVCGYDPDRQPASITGQLPLLDLLSSLLSSVLDADQQATTTARALERATVEAETDAMTGLLNRRGWDRFLAREEVRYRRFGDPACVVVLDLDHLKTVNDTQGHAAGDRYIKRAGEVLGTVIRPRDVLARLGGDEFGVVAVGATRDQADQLVMRMQQALESAGIASSFGHAPYSVVAGFPGAWHAADLLMYEQKRRRKAPSGS